MKKTETTSFSQSELNELFKRFENGDFNARSEIIYKTYGLVYYCIKKYLNQGIDFDELVSSGALSLVKAVDSYKLERKTSFTTYATRCIHNEILNLIRKRNKTIEKNTISTSTPIVEDGSITIEDLLLSSENIEEDYCDKNQLEELLKLVYNLPEIEKFIILNYYGFNDLKRLEIKQIAQILGYSPSNTSRKMAKIHKNLKMQLINLGYDSSIYSRTRR